MQQHGRDGALFDDAQTGVTPPQEPLPATFDVSLRVVFWLTGDPPCLVRCDDGERNLRRIRKLHTICGLPCSDAWRTSREPAESYCKACLAGSARGVLR